MGLDQVETFEFRPGGFFHYAMRFSNGPQMWGRFLYREIAAPERITWLNSFSNEGCGITRAPFDASIPLEILNEATFSDEVDRTLVTLRARGELEALSCLGGAPRCLWAPVLASGALCGAGALCLGEIVVPPCERAIDRADSRAISPLTGQPTRAAWFRQGRWVYHVGPDRVMGLELGPGSRPLRRVDGARGVLLETRLDGAEGRTRGAGQDTRPGEGSGSLSVNL